MMKIGKMNRAILLASAILWSSWHVNADHIAIEFLDELPSASKIRVEIVKILNEEIQKDPQSLPHDYDARSPFLSIEEIDSKELILELFRIELDPEDANMTGDPLKNEAFGVVSNILIEWLLRDNFNSIRADVFLPFIHASDKKLRLSAREHFKGGFDPSKLLKYFDFEQQVFDPDLIDFLYEYYSIGTAEFLVRANGDEPVLANISKLLLELRDSIGRLHLRENRDTTVANSLRILNELRILDNRWMNVMISYMLLEHYELRDKDLVDSMRSIDDELVSVPLSRIPSEKLYFVE